MHKNGTEGQRSSECIVNKKNGYCSKHECLTKKIVVTSKVWKWKQKQHEYGYVNSKKTKYVCKRDVANNFTTVKSDDLMQLIDQSTEGASSNDVTHVSTSDEFEKGKFGGMHLTR